jgi:hypothetical protein
MLFFSFLTDFSYFPLQRNCRKLLGTLRTGKTNGPFEKDVGFSAISSNIKVAEQFQNRISKS